MALTRWSTFLAAALWCAATVEAGPPTLSADHDLAITPVEIGSPLDTAATVKLEVEIHNSGLQTWSTADGFALSYHWLGADGSVVVWDGERTPFDHPIGPGERRLVGATVRTPDRAGDYLLQWDVVQEGVLWVSEVDPTPVVQQPATVTTTHAFAAIEVSTPRILLVGGRRGARVVVQNDGADAWPADGSVAVAYHWLSADGDVVIRDGRRAPVNRAVAQGETIELEATVEAPAVAGRYRLQWDMVEEGVCWFSERAGAPDPGLIVVVLPSVRIGPGVWSLLVLMAAVAAVIAGGHAQRWQGVWSVADVVWCVAALMVKQGWVLAGADLRFSAAGYGLGWAGAAVVGLLLLVLPARVRPWAAWAAAAFATLVLFADLVHERFFGDLGSIAAVHSIGQVGQVEASIRSLLEWGDLWFWTDLLPALILVIVAGRLRSAAASRRRLAVALGGLLVVGGAAGAVGLRGDVASLRQIFHTTQLAQQIGVLNVHVLDLGRWLASAVVRSRLDDGDYREVVRFFEQRRSLRAGSGPLYGAVQGRNLVMVQVESLQAFIVGYRVGGREVTPFLNSLAAESLWFANVTDQTEEGRSSDSELTTQASLLPPDRGAAAFIFADNDFTGLASILAAHGYATLSAVPFEGSFWNRRTTHRAYGFETSLFVDDFKAGDQIGWGLNDRDFLAQAATRLANLPSPWCAYLLTLSLHHPFDGFPESRKVLDVGDWEGTPFGNFLHTMHFFDAALRAFVAELDASDVLDDTVVAIWGDHDAGFEWRPEIAEAIGVTPDPKGWYLSQQVPLVIRLPGQAASSRAMDVPAGHADVAPTLLALMGVDPAPYALMGRNLLGTPGPGPVIGEYRCWRDATHLYLRRGPSLADGECIELATMAGVATAACADGFEQSGRQVEVSTLVLEHDLQQRLHRDLAGGAP